ncbi:VIT family-domain-containing protein [Chytridium lagenaria]|nr:VIT family-domain-containing protein [Chytridium lagenaria]
MPSSSTQPSAAQRGNTQDPSDQPQWKVSDTSTPSLSVNPDDISPSTHVGIESDQSSCSDEETAGLLADIPKEHIPVFGHTHFSHRAPNLRAAVLGVNDGLVSISSLMLGVAGAGGDNWKAMILSGVAGTVAGALSMACGEYVSVASQKDSEMADVEREREEFLKGPEYVREERMELARIYMERGLPEPLAHQVVEALHDSANGDLTKIVAVHLRDELAIDVNALSNPISASVLSATMFVTGALVPLLPGSFITDPWWRVFGIVLASSIGLVVFGATGSVIGGASWLRGAVRVLVGGWIAMIGTYGVGLVFEKVGNVQANPAIETEGDKSESSDMTSSILLQQSNVQHPSDQPATQTLQRVASSPATSSPLPATTEATIAPNSSFTTLPNPDDISTAIPITSMSSKNYADAATVSVESETKNGKKPVLGHRHFSQRAPSLRAAVLGANDGLVSTSSLMLGFAGAGGDSRKIMILSGIAGTVAGALSMACGEYVSVASQKDSEVADVKRERDEFLKGPEYVKQERDELAHIYMERGLTENLAFKVVDELHTNANGDLTKIVAIHLRDELAIDVTFATSSFWRIFGIVAASSVGLVVFGAAGSLIGGARWWKGAIRVLLGGWIAMAGTYGVGLLFEKVAKL